MIILYKRKKEGEDGKNLPRHFVNSFHSLIQAMAMSWK